MRAKLQWLGPLLAAGLVAFVGWWADRQIRQVLEQELANDLRTTRNADVTALDVWMANQKRVANMLAEEPRLRSHSLDLLDPLNSRELNRQAYSRLVAQILIGEHLQDRLNELGFKVAQVVNTNFQVVFDTGRPHSRAGQLIADELQGRFSELFASGKPVIITPFKLQPPEPQPPFGHRFERPRQRSGDLLPALPPPRSGGPPHEVTVMQVAAPLRDTNGITRGALALIIDPDAEFSRILSVARSGDTGETFAFGPDGVMLSRSRFDDELKKLGLIDNRPDSSSALTLHLTDPGGDLTRGYKPAETNAADRPLIEMVRRAANGQSAAELTPFRDYRGVPVIGAWTWMPTYGFGVGTKMDAREAFHTLRVVHRVFIVLFLLLVLASLAFWLFSYRRLVWQRRLSEAELKARQLGQYKLIEKLGEGAMGTVYKAHHALLRRETALKLLTPDKASAQAVQRFEREVRLTCQLTHPNTIQIYDYGRTPEGIFYFAMEYLDGLDLRQLVARYGPQPEGRIINVLVQICESLAEAHALALIHRDIKPANVFLCDRGGVPDLVKLLDFGLVRAVGARHDAHADALEWGSLVGTPAFIAPETIEDATRSDERSDLYSVGAVGYYLLTGAYVFEGESVAEICRKCLTEKPIPPSTRLGRPICPHLEAAVMRCLDHDPKARPQTAHQLIALLNASSRVAEWTVEHRAAWWVQHRQSAARAHGPVTAEDEAPSLDIALADRVG